MMPGASLSAPRGFVWAYIWNKEISYVTDQQKINASYPSRKSNNLKWAAELNMKK